MKIECNRQIMPKIEEKKKIGQKSFFAKPEKASSRDVQ